MYLPEPLGVLLFYQNQIMLKQYSLGMTGLECGLSSVLVLGQVVRTEAARQKIAKKMNTPPVKTKS